MVTETGNQIYCEFKGIDIQSQDEWIKTNVLDNTILYGGVESLDLLNDNTLYYVGTKEEVRKSLSVWLSQFDSVQLVSDVCHYDMVLFIDIFGTAFDLPDNVSAYCHDINQDISAHFAIDDSQAFDYSREQILEDNGIKLNCRKHNSLYDAIVIKNIYDLITE